MSDNHGRVSKKVDKKVNEKIDNKVNKRVGLLTACALVCAIVVAGAGAGNAGPSGFRCPTTGLLISTGQSMLEVRSKCREPDEARASVELRTVREKVRRWVNGVSEEESIERTIEVPIDEWTYDFGRNRFIQFLRFEHGRLIWVREGGKGVTDPE